MENATNLNETLFIFDNTHTAGQNGTLPSLFPASTIAAATVGSLGMSSLLLVPLEVLYS